MKYAAILSSLFLIIGCKITNDSKIKTFANYQVIYKEIDRSIEATVYLKEGDSLANASYKALKAPMLFQGRRMSLVSQESSVETYMVKIRSDYPKQFIFRWDEVNEQRIEMVNIADFDIHIGPSWSSGMSILIEEGLQKGELLTCVFITESGKASSFVVEGPTKSNKIQIPKSNIQQLPLGRGELYFVKEKNGSLIDDIGEAEYSITYFTESRGVEVIQ